MTDGDPGAAPDDAALLAAGGWSAIPSARIMAKAVVDDFCVVLDANGADGSMTYETIEFYSRTHDGRWIDDGQIGPAGDGPGWHIGYVYLHGRATGCDVAVAYEDRIHRVPVVHGRMDLRCPPARVRSPAAPPANRLGRVL